MTGVIAKFDSDNFALNQWLNSINCEQYASLFTENGIVDYDLITQLDYGSLKELGVLKIGDLVRLERSLNSMKVSELLQRNSSKTSKGLATQFIDDIVKYQIKSFSEIGVNNDNNGNSSNNHNVENDGYFSESDNDGSIYDEPATNKRLLKEDDSDLKKSLNHSNNSTSTINSTESNESSISSHTSIHSKDNTPNAAIAALAHVTEMDKHIAVFILQNGNIKKINTSGCYNAEAIKRKLLKKLSWKPNSYENYNTYFIDSNNSIHLMFDVELVSLVRSSDRVERNRIIFCKSNEDPSKEALATSRKISFKYEANGPNKRKGKSQSSDDEAMDSVNDLLSSNKTKYINVNTTSSANLRRDSRKKVSSNKSPSYARARNKDMEPLYEQRPPSELISSNLAEYFPETPSKDLHQTIKNSVRYSVRMSRAFSRLSMMSTNSSVTRNSIMTLQNSPRTIGDVWMSNASELDEAVLGDDTQFMDIMGAYKRPKSRFVPSGAPPLPEIDIHGDKEGGKPKETSKAEKQKRPTTPKSRIAKNRLSVAINSGNETDSRIELLDLSNTDSESESGYEFDDQDPETVMKDLESQSSIDTNTGPQHWLKGKRIGSGSFGVVYLGLNSFTGELMAVKQVEIPKVDQLAVSTAGSDGATISSNDDATTLKGINTLGSNETVTKQRKAGKGVVGERQDNGDDKSKDHKQSMIDALQREMALLKELKHEKIVRYLGSSSDDTYLNIFLEYVPGGSITSMINNYGPFKEPLIRNFTRQILIGLKYLHSKNIIHRDIKGGNILIDNNGGAKISDFGISKKIETSMQPKRASLQGSVYWMAPEVVRQVTNSEKSDIWSVGCLIIEMFTGKHPFPEFSQMQAIFRIGTHSSPEIPDKCTEECKDFLKKTFIIEYEKRPSAKELLSHAFLNSLIMAER
ncbi:mitogen-activated protein kinase kinase kinase [Saccharomycopsis crataegensis]|uniref:mitogen-activated protein kinase kinase kinase n=1 Tax=Saccharomycopsis crataegensis TaxID=43959 RepID=A0AAV5QNR0_9ASCO|nr:mitogen-activated protein kinase kinase kinase [Saccharomycopsis crataegensis]